MSFGTSKVTTAAFGALGGAAVLGLVVSAVGVITHEPAPRRVAQDRPAPAELVAPAVLQGESVESPMIPVALGFEPEVDVVVLARHAVACPAGWYGAAPVVLARGADYAVPQEMVQPLVAGAGPRDMAAEPEVAPVAGLDVAKGQGGARFVLCRPGGTG